MKQLSIWTRSLLLLCLLAFCSSNGWAWNRVHLIGNFTENNWDSGQTNYPFISSTVDDSKSYYEVSVTPGTTYYFAVYINDARRGPNTPNADITQNEKVSDDNYHRANANYNSWMITPTTNKIRIWSDQNNNHDETPWIWVEEIETHETKYPINISAGEGGTVSPSGSQQVGATGINVTATPNTGYRFKEWTFTGGAHVVNPTSATTTLIAIAAGTVTANFELSSTPTPTPSNTDYAYYLIGNFMNTDGANINRTNLIFRFNQTGANTYTFDVPATLNVNSQIYSISAEGVETVYGPTSNTVFNISNNSSADYNLTEYALDEESCHFIAHDRTLDSDGMYTYTLTVNNEGIPTSVKVKHTQLTRVAYFLPDATDATAQPAYSTRNEANSSGNNKYFGSVNLQENQKCFVISNIRQQADDTYHHGLRFTQNKLYRQGNGGYDVINGNNVGDIDIHKVYPVWANTAKTVSADGFTFGGQAGAYTLEYNPSVGINDVVNVSENALIGGEVKKAGFGDLPDVINSINIVGTGITGSFELNTRVPMTYNQTLKCYEYTFDSSSEESATNLFRFVANDSWAINWGEESDLADDHAKVPYQGEGLGHTAMPDDPNDLKQYNTWTEGTGKDIIFNRPAGHWTIRFYIVTESVPGGNEYTNKYYYTINGSPLSPYDVPIYGGRVLCSFSSDKDLEIPDGYRAYVAHSFVQKQAGSNNTQDGTVNLYRIKYIPKNVGVILYGDYVATNGTTVTVPFHDYTGEQLTGVNLWYNTHNGEQFNNYLVDAPNGCTLLENGELDQQWRDKGKYYYLARYYAFTWFSKTKNGKLYTWTEPTNAPKQGTLDSGAATAAGLNLPAGIKDYASFFRAKGTVGKNRAYLSLPKEVMDYNGQALVQNQDEDDNLFAKTSLRFDDFFYEDDFNEGEVTDVNSVKNAFKTTKDNAYYNLQGMKVSNPTKGLYIINGKKVIIK